MALPQKKPTRNIQLPSADGGKRAKPLIFLGGIIILLLIAWNFWISGEIFQTSTLNTTFNRLSSTEVKFSIPQAGKLIISAGPSNFLSGANVFSLVMSADKASPVNTTTPFTTDPAYTTVLNGMNPDATKEMVLTIHFPAGRFTSSSNTIAELPFSTTEAGQFEIKSIYFGSISSTSFPPLQEYPVFIASSNILYNEKGETRIAATPTQPNPTPTKPACSDTVDNDADGKIDHPLDPGCADANDTNETDPAGPAPLRLDLPAQHLKSVQTLDYQTEIIAILPSAQEQLQYQFTLKAAGGKGAYTFGVRGKSPNINQSYPLSDSGLVLRTTGVVTGDPTALKAANYRYPLFVTDGEQTLNFSLQIAVNDAFGNPVGLIIETNFTGTEHRCEVGKVCEAFFKATKGIEPYLYSFSGESPTGTAFLQVNAGQAFYRFTPTVAQIGSYHATVSVTDSSKPSGATQPVARASVPFTLTIAAAEIESSFRFSADRACDFLDLSTADPNYVYFQFTCRNGVMEGSQGLIRADDSLNRAEAAKITTLIVSDETAATDVFAPFVGLSAATQVNYTDVSVGDWYARYVYYLFKEGIIVNNVLYRPADTLNAAEALKLVVESFAPLNDDLAQDLLDITDYNDWFEPYQTIASYVDASIAYVDPALPAKREWIAELLYKLHRSYPASKFQ